jgi:hypothetical protein
MLQERAEDSRFQNKKEKVAAERFSAPNYSSGYEEERSNKGTIDAFAPEGNDFWVFVERVTIDPEKDRRNR